MQSGGGELRSGVHPTVGLLRLVPGLSPRVFGEAGRSSAAMLLLTWGAAGVRNGGMLRLGFSVLLTLAVAGAVASAGARPGPLDGGSAKTARASDPVIAAAGDIACDPSSASFNGGAGTTTACAQLATSNLVVGQNLAAVLALGDDQYGCGGYSAFLQSYDPSWGRVKSITHPVPGNHEYQSSGGTNCDTSGTAQGYFSYFGTAAGDPSRGYYSFQIGAWHLVALNSNCANVSGCGTGSPEETWLRADLKAHASLCTLAFWHHPRFTSGVVADDPSVAAFWQDLYKAGADVVLNGHAHGYERFAPQTPTQTADAKRGIREFVVGTGQLRLAILRHARRQLHRLRHNKLPLTPPTPAGPTRLSTLPEGRPSTTPRGGT
jgi:acid phosphatase type 7